MRLHCIQNYASWFSTLNILLSFKDSVIIHCTIVPLLCLPSVATWDLTFLVISTCFEWYFQCLGSQIPDSFSLVVLPLPSAVTHFQGQSLVNHVIPTLCCVSHSDQHLLNFWVTFFSILTVILSSHWDLWFYHLFTTSYFLRVRALFYPAEFHS